GDSRRKTDPGRGGDHGQLHRFRGGPGGPGAGGRRRGLQLRPRARHHQADREPAAEAGAGHRARRHRRRTPPTTPGAARRTLRRFGRSGPLDRFRQPRDTSRWQVPRGSLAGRRTGGAGLGLLPGLPEYRMSAVDELGRRGGRDDLRRDGRVAGVRLDGRGQGGSRVLLAVPGTRPGTARDPGQPGLGRAVEDPGREGDPGFRGPGVDVERPGAARVGRAGPGSDGASGRGAALGLLPRDDRGDRARRRWLPRDGRL
ncbi:MAG: Enoyl-[acyl-carrier-protein] reductase [NADH], partial [uncultured Nocardioidaceae bacterium]